MQKNPEPDPARPREAKLTPAQREHLLAQVAALAGATLQKIWLSSPSLLTLQLRLPGQTVLVALDARAAMAAKVSQRPAAGGAAPKGQASLRASLAGASLSGARQEREEGAPDDSRQAPSLRLLFETPQGPRALSTAPRASALALLAPASRSSAQEPAVAPGGDRILWMSAAQGELHPGGRWPAMRDAGSRPGQTAAMAQGEQARLPGGDDVAARVLAGGETDALRARARELAKALRSRAQKLTRTLRAVEADFARAQEAGEERARAKLLLPEQSRIARGAREARLPDWSRLDAEGRPAQVTVALDPALSAAQNAARWMKRAQRYLSALPRIEARRAEVAARLAATRALLAAAEAAKDEAELSEVARKAGTSATTGTRPGTGTGSGTGTGTGPGTGRRRPYRIFRGWGGERILVGRSARDNDALTFAAARGNDLWLHARGVQGSHVVVADPGESPGQRTLLEAAMLAAHFSSARGEEQVEVSWTRKKHVRKQKGAPPGAVTYSQERSVRVRMERELLDALLAREEK